MAGRLSRSWDLVKSSWDVLQKDKELLVFPLVSSIALIGVVICFALPVIGVAGFDGLARYSPSGMGAVQYAVAFLFYLAQYFVIFYFNAALVGAAMKRLDGGDPTVGDGFAIANSRLANILGYAFVAATVGMILRLIQERVGFLGKIVVGLVGAGWSVATYLVVPVLVSRDIGPIEAVKESAQLFKRTWGENIAGQAGMGLAFAMIYLAILFVGIAMIVGAAMTESVVLVVSSVAILLAAMMIAFLVHGALSGIYSAALYRFATDAPAGDAFDRDALQLAFRTK